MSHQMPPRPISGRRVGWMKTHMITQKAGRLHHWNSSSITSHTSQGTGNRRSLFAVMRSVSPARFRRGRTPSLFTDEQSYKKNSPQRSAQSKFSITSANTNVTSEPQTPSTDTKAAAALSVGSESDIGLTPESSYLASEGSEARLCSTTPELDSPAPSLQPFNLNAHKFDRWMFDTSESLSSRIH
jgi:hypothetical protein